MANDDPYVRFKILERELKLVNLEHDSQEEILKKEIEHLKRELLQAQEKLKKFQKLPLYVGQLLETINHDYAIIQSSTCSSNFYVRILSTVNRDHLKPSAIVGLHRDSYAVVHVLPPDTNPNISLLDVSERPNITFSDIGGYEEQKQEIREVVELPLTHRELFRQIGIDPPRGVLLYGPPGTGKTMLVKAIANHTAAAFIRVAATEFVQTDSGEGPQMVHDLFHLARQNAPAIIFIDEVDAIAAARSDTQYDHEIHRILMELLNQMDGFDQSDNVIVIMATNKADTLDPALLRPGRLDRKIEFPLPDRRHKSLIFQICTAKMNLSNEVDLEDYISQPDQISAAEIEAVCQAAGKQAIRKNRYIVFQNDFEKGYRSIIKKSETEFDFYN